MKRKRIGIRTLAVLALAGSLSAQGADISWNGFGSAYYGQAFSKDLLPARFTDRHVNFTSFSLMGLNLGGSINDDLDYAAQIVALGSPVGTTDNFGLLAQWAYLNYLPNERTTLRLGRQLFPQLLASEYVRVAYLLPFRQIPTNVFDLLPFTRFDGAAANYRFDAGSQQLTVGIFGGKPLIDVDTSNPNLSGVTFNFADLFGVQATLDGDGWRIRAQGSRFFSQLQTVPPTTPTTNNLTGIEYSYSIGYRFDKHQIVSWGEYIRARTPGGTPTATGNYADSGYGYYVLAGYRLGKFLPRYTFAKASQNYNAIISPNGRSKIHTWGLNYQAGSQAVVKVEYELDQVPSPGGGGYFVTQPAGTTAKSGSAFYAGVDFIF